MRRGLLGGLILLWAAGASWAQAPQGPLARGPGRARDEVFKMIDAYIVSNLQESLSLTDEQFVKLLPLVKRLQSDRRTFAQRRQQALQALRRALGSGVASESQVAEFLRELKAAEAEGPAALQRDLEAIDANLTPLQQAKYRVLEAELQRRIRDLMARIRSQGAGGVRPGRGGSGGEPQPRP